MTSTCWVHFTMPSALSAFFFHSVLTRNLVIPLSTDGEIEIETTQVICSRLYPYQDGGPVI